MRGAEAQLQSAHVKFCQKQTRDRLSVRRLHSTVVCIRMDSVLFFSEVRSLLCAVGLVSCDTFAYDSKTKLSTAG